MFCSNNLRRGVVCYIVQSIRRGSVHHGQASTHQPPSGKKQLAWTALVIFVLLTAAVCWFVGRPMLRFVSEPEKFRLWVDGHGLWGGCSMWGCAFCRWSSPSSPGEPLEIAGGYAFGAVWGTVLCLIGLFLGSVVIFALVRRFGQSVVEVFFPPEKLHSLRFLQSSPKRNLLFWIVFTMPGTPKDLLCYFAGADGSAVGTWLLMCSLGRLPSVVSSTIGGDALGLRNYQFAVLAFAVTMLISLGGHRDLPDALPPPCPSSGAIMQSCKNIRPWQPPADVLYCGRLIFR